MDILGEAAVSESEADAYRDLYLSMVDVLSEEMSSWPAGDAERERYFPRLNVSVKLSSLYSRIGPLNSEDSIERVKERLRPIFRELMSACLPLEPPLRLEPLLDDTGGGLVFWVTTPVKSVTLRTMRPAVPSMPRTTGGPKDENLLYTAAQLEAVLAPHPRCDILELAELDTELSEGRGHVGIASVVRITVRKS